MDYRDISFSQMHLEEVRRRIRNDALTAEELVDSLADEEVAAMWDAIEEEYSYDYLENDPHIVYKILFYYLRETLLKNIVTDECELNNQELRHYFEYWFALRK